MKRKGITLKTGQCWRIGKGTIKKVFDLNNGLSVSDRVVIVAFHGSGLIEVQCLDSMERFDIMSTSLCEVISNEA